MVFYVWLPTKRKNVVLIRTTKMNLENRMKIELREITEENKEECFSLKVSPAQSEYIASNEASLKEAEENAEVARSFAIYADNRMVGFTMFAFDENNEDPDDKYWLWRFMIDKALQGKGYGR